MGDSSQQRVINEAHRACRRQALLIDRRDLGETLRLSPWKMTPTPYWLPVTRPISIVKRHSCPV